LNISRPANTSRVISTINQTNTRLFNLELSGGITKGSSAL
jgi:hypothetical protein